MNSREVGIPLARRDLAALQKIGDTGLEFQASRLPPPLRGALRGLIIRFIKARKLLRFKLFALQYPLPQLAVFESPSWYGLVGKSYPMQLLTGSAQVVELPSLRPDQRGGKKLRHTSGPAGPLAGLENKCRFLYSSVMRQPIVGIIRVRESIEHAGDETLEERLEQLERAFIDALNSFRLTKSHERRGRVLIVVSSDGHPPNCKNSEILRRVSVLNTSISVVPATVWSAFWSPEQAAEPPDNPCFEDRGEELFFARLRAEIQLQTAQVSHRARPPLVQVVNNSIGSSSDKWFFGFGDILLGAALVYEEAEKQCRLAIVDWTGFSAREALTTGPDNVAPPLLAPDEPVTQQINSDVPVDFSRRTRVFTNRRPLNGFPSTTRDFLFRNGVWPSDQTHAAITNYLSVHGLKEGHFDVIHVRFGDLSTQKKDISGRIYSGLEELTSLHGEYLVMSDHPEKLDRYRGVAGLTIRDGAPSHSGQEVSPEAFTRTLEDFFLIGKSQRVFVLSRYAWGSGFSSTAANLFGVPITPWVTHRTSHYPTTEKP